MPICPKANDPDVKAKVEAKYKEIANKSNRLTDSQEHWHKKDPDLKYFSGNSLEKIKNQVIAANTNGSSITMG